MTIRMTSAPDPEVPEKAKRRRFTADYKLSIVQAAERCTQSGDVGALLRREGTQNAVDDGREVPARHSAEVTKTLDACAGAPATRALFVSMSSLSPLRIEQAIANLERTLIREAEPRVRRLVLEGESNPDIPWSNDGAVVHPDARVWLAWRRLPEFPPYLLVPTPAGLELAQLIDVVGDSWHRLRKDANDAHRPELVPVLEQFYCDGSDGSIWQATWDGEGQLRFERFAHDLASLLLRIEGHYAARSQSPWRRLRIACEQGGDAARSRRADRWDEAELAHLPVGTVLLTTFSATNRFAKRGTVSLKLGPEQWVATGNRVWDGGNLDDAQLEEWMVAFRSQLGSGVVDVQTDEAHAARIGIEASKPGGAVHLSAVRVWSQPSIETLLGRLDQVLARFPELRASLRPGASDADFLVVERALDATLPAALRSLYAFADGQSADGPSFYWRYRWLSLREALREHACMCELRDRQFGPAYWDDASLPFLGKMTADHIYVDIGGACANSGAVVDFNHEQPAVRTVLYGGVAEWLECFVDGLEHGLYVLEDEGMFPRDFIATLEWDNVRAHDRARTNGRYPWTATLALTDA